MRVKDLKRFYQDKDEHYEISDSFVKANNGRYQQKESTDPKNYMGYAYKCGMIIDHKLAEPNQKWHLLESYCERKNEDTDVRIGGLKCPELLLWMAEAAGIDRSKLEQAKKEACKIIDEAPDGDYKGNVRNKAGARIIEIVNFKNLEKIIMEYEKNQI